MKIQIDIGNQPNGEGSAPAFPRLGEIEIQALVFVIETLLRAGRRQRGAEE